MDKATAPAVTWNIFGSSAELAAALSGSVANTLRGAIDKRGVGFIAVSGGTTPALFFRALSNEDLDWSKVVVTLADERFVERSSPRANAGLVKANLLQNKAAAARFVDLYQPAPDVETAVAMADRQLPVLPWPLDITMLGMGSDGHTASFFPDAANLAALLDPGSKDIVLPVHAANAGEPRLTLTLARLAEAPFVALHIEGGEKRKVLESTLGDGPKLPVRSVLEHASNPVQVFWAP